MTTGPTQAPRQPGLREQIDRTIAAARALFEAHRALLQAELAEIGGEIGRIAAMVGGIVALALFTTLLLTIGGGLFLSEWLFGSIGWGVALGTLLCVGVGVTLALGVVGAPRRVMGGGFLVGLGVAIVVGAILAADLPRRIAQSLADGLGTGPGGLDPQWAPTIVGLVVVAIVLGVLGFLLFARVGGMSTGIGGAVVALVLGALIGGLLGGLTFSRHGGVAVGIAVGLLAWPIASAVLLRGARFDPTARFRGLWPKESYEAALATKAWLEQRWEERPGHRTTHA